MVPPGRVQIPGFTDSDSHQDVVEKGAQGTTHFMSFPCLYQAAWLKMMIFLVENPGPLVITQLNLEVHMPEGSEFLEYLYPLMKMMLITRYI